jgi:uncharacterized repeat protein (TIGR03847 family)
MTESFEMDPVDGIAAGTSGPPGQRQFFLRVSHGTASFVLNCEKFHVQTLVMRIRQLLEAQELKPELTVGPRARPAPPGLAEWTIGELGLGYHESRRMFVIVARELPSGGDGGAVSPDTLATARLWLTPDQVAVFAAQADSVVTAGRPACPHCGLPIDPAGHPCPAANGSRPIV